MRERAPVESKSPRGRRPAAPAAEAEHRVLSLQRSAGNRATAAVLARKEKMTGNYVDMGKKIGCFEIESFQVGSAGGGGKRDVKEATVTSKVDKHSSSLMQHATKGLPIPEVKLVLQRDGMSLTYVFKGVLISSYHMGGSGPDQAMETWSMNYESVEISHGGSPSSFSSPPFLQPSGPVPVPYPG